MNVRRRIVTPGIIAGIVVLSWKFLTSPVSPHATDSDLVSIERGESVDMIALKLKSKGLIRSAAAFKILVMAKNIATNMQAGEYRLSPSMSLGELSQSLTHGTSDVTITLVEGWRREEMADALEKTLVDSGGSFAKAVFLKTTQDQEGYLFPDTYRLSKNMTEKEIASLLRATFDMKVNDELQSQISSQGLSMEEAVTIASIVEREAHDQHDRPLVAGILIKRIRADWPLQADATVQYALGYQTQTRTWWKRSLTSEDLNIDSPFNTYIHKGIPPAPICNPSLTSLQAVANQELSDYWYYLSDTQGRIHYAKTIGEHTTNIARYLRN